MDSLRKKIKIIIYKEYRKQHKAEINDATKIYIKKD